MQILAYICWCLLGTALFLSGCKAGISAKDLSASITINDPAAPNVTVVNSQPPQPVPSL